MLTLDGKTVKTLSSPRNDGLARLSTVRATDSSRQARASCDAAAWSKLRGLQ